MSTAAQSRLLAGFFLAAAVMLWVGRVLLPVQIPAYFAPDLFPAIHDSFHLWIWLYRVHIFGIVTTLIAIVSLTAVLSASPARILIWPGAAVISAGLLVTALSAAFYYHHGAWGAIELAGKSTVESQAFVDALRVDTEYVTCLTRFGRVFTGFGFIVLAAGLHLARALAAWLLVIAALLGVAAMALTMALPDDLHFYQPLFHLHCLWLFATGIVILRGLRINV